MPDTTQYQPVITNNIILTIASSASLSDSADLNGTTLSGYIMPASWTAADITLQASVDGTNFSNIYDQFGNEARHIVSSSRFIALNPSDFASIRFLKIRSGTSGTPVNQAAQRQITLITRPV